LRGEVKARGGRRCENIVDDEQRRDRPQPPSARRVAAGRGDCFVAPPPRCAPASSSSSLRALDPPRSPQSGRTMARTGLRMMPTFPSSPLKSRTVGFPQYGLKASMSDSAFLNGLLVKPAPGMPSPPLSLPPPFAHFRRGKAPGSEPRAPRASMCRCARGFRPSTPEVLGSGSSYVVSIHPCLIQPHAPVPQARCDFASRLYAAPSLCGSASATRGTFPTFLAVLSIHVVDLTPAVRRALPLYTHGDSRLPRNVTESPSTTTVSASNARREIRFRGCIVRFMLRPACLPSPPDWLRRDEVICSSPRLLRCIVTPASGAVRRRTTLGVRLDGRTGNLPSSGLSPDKTQQPVRLHDDRVFRENLSRVLAGILLAVQGRKID